MEDVQMGELQTITKTEGAGVDGRPSVEVRKLWEKKAVAYLTHTSTGFSVKLHGRSCGEERITPVTKWPGKALRLAYKWADEHEIRITKWSLREVA